MPEGSNKEKGGKREMLVGIGVDLTWKRMINPLGQAQYFESRHFSLVGTVGTDEPVEARTFAQFLLELEQRINQRGDIRAHLTLTG